MSGSGRFASAGRRTIKSHRGSTELLRRRGPLSSALLLLAIASCASPRPAELATLEQIWPTEVEVGEQIMLSGHGFVVGPATLELQGILSAPGQAVSGDRTTLEIPVLATSPTTASARVSRRLLEPIGSAHSTFSGRATLRFDSAAGPDAPSVAATLDAVRLELFAGPVTQQSAAHRAQQRGRAVLDELGITGTVLPEGRGVRVERILSSSRGAAAGLRPGEVIVSAGAVTVSSISDLAPPPRTYRLLLGVRSVDGQFRRISCSLEQPTLSPDADRIAALSIAGTVLLLLLIAAGPLRGPARWFGAQLARGAGGPRTVLAQLNSGGPLQAILAVLLFATAPFAVMAVAHLGVVLAAGLTVLIATLSAGAMTRGWRRAPEAAGGALRALPLVVAAVVGALRATSVDLEAVVASQGAAPWQWNALADPAALALLVVVGAVSCSRPSAQMTPLASLTRGLIGAMIAATLLGGWTLPGDSELWWGAVLFAAKSWLVGLTLAQAGRCRLIVALPVAAGLGGLTLGTLLVPLPGWAPSALTWSAASAALFLLVPLLLRLWSLPPKASPASSRGQPDPWVGKHPGGSPIFEAIPGHS